MLVFFKEKQAIRYYLKKKINKHALLMTANQHTVLLHPRLECSWRTANHEHWLKVLLKVKRLKIMMNLNAFTMKKVLVHERGQIALSMHSQVKLKFFFSTSDL